MTDIDYTQFKIVGVVEAQPNTKHAIINAVGYLGSDWKFTPLYQQKLNKFFLPEDEYLLQDFKTDTRNL